MRTGFVITLALLAGLFASHAAFAQTTGTPPTGSASVTFPIAELGGCGSKDACRLYCDDAAHASACVAYGQTHGLMSPAQANAARTVLAKKGPGNCGSANECKTYCADTSHASECIAFAQGTGLVATSTAILAKKIISSGGPGGCTTATECATYCHDAAHTLECKQFAEENGQQQAATETNISEVLSQGTGPGGCSDAASCKTYCALASHGTECRAFALQNGLITQDQFEQAQKIASTTGPGGCKGDQCKAKCDDPKYHAECLNLAVKVGVITQDVASSTQKLEDVIKTDGGPGGCSSLAECKTYCEDSTHSAECSQYLEDHNIAKPLPPPQTSRSEDGVGPNGSVTPVPRPLTTGSSTIPAGTKPPLETEHPKPPVTSGSTSTSPSTAVPPKPPVPGTTDASRANTSTGKIICRTLDQCKAVCGTNTANCEYIPLPANTSTTNPSGTATPPPTSATLPPPAAGTVPPPPTSGTTLPAGTKIICHTLDECKAVCGTNTALCQFVPLSTPTNTTTQPTNTSGTSQPNTTSTTSSSLGAAVMIAVAKLLGF